jgi:hypothetical protein
MLLTSYGYVCFVALGDYLIPIWYPCWPFFLPSNGTILGNVVCGLCLSKTGYEAILALLNGIVRVDGLVRRFAIEAFEQVA